MNRKGTAYWIRIVVTIIILVIVAAFVGFILGRVSGLVSPPEERSRESFRQLVAVISGLKDAAPGTASCASTDDGFFLGKEYYLEVDSANSARLVLRMDDEGKIENVDEAIFSNFESTICCDKQREDGEHCTNFCGDGKPLLMGREKGIDGKVCVCKSVGQFKIWQEDSSECRL